MNNGTLNIGSTGNMNAAGAIRLGGDFGNTGFQDQTKTGTLQLIAATGGQTFSNTINSVTGNTSGTLAVNSLNTSGTNTLSGHIATDSALKITQTTGGTLNITQVRATGTDTATGLDLKSSTLTFAGGGNFGVSSTIYNSGSGANNGNGSLVMSGTGVLTLSATNTHANTTLNSGVVSVNSQLQLGNSSGNVTFNGGTLRITGSSSFDSGLSRTFNVTTAGGTIETNSTTMSTIQGQIIAASGGVLTKTGTGSSNVLRLSGTADNVNLGFNINAGTSLCNRVQSSTWRAVPVSLLLRTAVLKHGLAR